MDTIVPHAGSEDAQQWVQSCMTTVWDNMNDAINTF
jgi:hypothetical protein